MKSGARLLLLAVLASIARTVSGVFSLNGMSPVTRVVELLKELQTLCEENLEKETKAFEKFKCWATTTMEVKTASNEKAQARVDSLEQYIADLKAGRIELTSERVDLEKEISSVTADLETAEALRDKEHEDFLAAEDETNKAIAALEEAIEVMEEAQPEGGGAAPSASFLTASRGSGSRLQARKADFERLTHAVEFGRRFLSKGDAIFLERVLTGDVPETDWKKLNRKADFKMSYKTRTGKIVQTLKNLKFTFTTTLDDMTHKEEKAVEIYDKLKESKTAQKDAAVEALSKMELEGAARGQTKGEAQTELDDLKTQIKNDEKFIEQANTELKEKDGEFVARKKIRMDEISAVSEAIQVLHKDDSRDLFKRSLSSQGYVQISSRGYQFVQKSQSRAHVRHLLASAPGRASALIRRTAARAGQDKRLVELANKVAGDDEPAGEGLGADKFDKVISMIDDIVVLLKDEEEADLKTKEECETTRMEDTRESILLARTIDELSDTITSAKAKIAELEVQIEEKEDEIKVIDEELDAATTLRGEEKDAFAKTDKDDEDAAATIAQAIDVLEGFYKAQAFIQQKHRLPSNDFVADAGAAPPPPPKTWDDPSYTGRDKESGGILAILTMLKDDIIKDRTKAQAAEDKAQEHYDEYKLESETQVGGLNTAINGLKGVIGEKETEVEEADGERTTTKGELVTLIEKIKELQPGCDYMLVNYIVRSANRKIEIDGLEKAKAILKGAEFDESDPNAELVPGNALLQKK